MTNEQKRELKEALRGSNLSPEQMRMVLIILEIRGVAPAIDLIRKFRKFAETVKHRRF